MRTKFNFVEPKLIMSVVVALIILVVGVFAMATVTTETNRMSEEIGTETTAYDEDYQDDTVDANPSDSWYTYYESGLPYQNVTNDTGHSSTQSFRLNTTQDADTTGGCLYNFTREDDYETISMKIKINESLHNYTMITIGSWIPTLSDDGAMAYWEINDTFVRFYVLTLGTDTYTEVYNNTIVNMTWYKLVAHLNYDNYEVQGELWNLSSNTRMNQSTETCIHEFTNITQTFMAINDAHGDDSCFIYVDDLAITDTDYPNEPMNVMTTGDSVFGIIGILMVIGAIMLLVGLMYSKYR